ncbi:MAG: hypothetical protein LQ338_000652 [Usnochroma carphineum]|nr:MAG: hypothetical protein LQ338_000652 [Usnochroma carphineum]
MFIQSHTPFADLIHQTSPEDPTKTPLAEKTILVTGGDGERCRKVAEAYGFRSVVIPADIITANPTIWPFTSPQNYESHARPLPLPIYDPSSSRPPSPDTNLTIHSIFIYNDPRDWALDTQILLDVLLSDRGILGTTTATNEQQIPLYFSNPDILFSSHHPHPRLGQGAFLAAFLGVWDAVTGGKQPLKYSVIGKPSQSTFEFAEKKLREHRRELLGLPPTNTNGAEEVGAGGLRKVYMIGDNPASDILGGNSYKSPFGSQWDTILVRSGVFNSSSSHGLSSESQPTKVVDDVWDAVEWALWKEKWLDGEKLEPKETGEEGNSWMQGGPVTWGERSGEVKG